MGKISDHNLDHNLFVSHFSLLFKFVLLSMGQNLLSEEDCLLASYDCLLAANLLSKAYCCYSVSKQRSLFIS